MDPVGDALRPEGVQGNPVDYALLSFVMKTNVIILEGIRFFVNDAQKFGNSLFGVTIMHLNSL
ncbi:hypothetical protein PSTEL_01460 [Paenibacillus stellifer]|uniref:Uncharacterized protein n=1 Tax=Paenibacillus stellifer TaxID=169760 RepID=A0A089LM93_9BACL|nr:hypothetical protein PSTEL_01460 [Paenibacillus stellifer]